MTIFSFIYSLSNLIVYSLSVRGQIEDGRPFLCIGSQGFTLPLGYCSYIQVIFQFLLHSQIEIHPLGIYCLLHKGIRGSQNVILLNSYFVSTHQNFRCKRTLRYFNKDILGQPSLSSLLSVILAVADALWICTAFLWEEKELQTTADIPFPLPPVSLLRPGRENEHQAVKGKTLWQGEGFHELSHGHSRSASCLSKGQLILL